VWAIMPYVQDVDSRGGSIRGQTSVRQRANDYERRKKGEHGGRESNRAEIDPGVCMKRSVETQWTDLKGKRISSSPLIFRE
jgi:hypothetical protein